MLEWAEQCSLRIGKANWSTGVRKGITQALVGLGNSVTFKEGRASESAGLKGSWSLFILHKSMSWRGEEQFKSDCQDKCKLSC